MTLAQSYLTVTDRQDLLPIDQRHLRQTLGALPAELLGEVADLLGFSSTAVSPGRTSPDARPMSIGSSDTLSSALLSWATGPMGPGLSAVETTLAKVIAKHSTTAKAVLSFALVGSIHDITLDPVEAFVKYLNERIGDSSIDIAFFEPGGIQLILRGSENALERLQDLFALGKLKYATLPPIEAVSLLDESTLDIRKARLVKALQLRDQSLSSFRSRLHANARMRARALARTRHLTLARVLIRDLNRLRSNDLHLMHDIDLHSDVDGDIARASTREINSEIDIAHAIALIRALESALSRTYNRKIARAIRRARRLATIHTYTRYSAFTFGLDRVIAFALYLTVSRALSLSLTRTLDLASGSGTLNLARADLRGANLVNLNLIEADLSNADLTGADLTGADLTGADVSGTLFGDNLGLTTSQQKALQRNGAIFQNCIGLVWHGSETLYGQVPSIAPSTLPQ